MTREERQKLREVARLVQIGIEAQDRVVGYRAYAGWILQTSNSFRRIGQYGDGDVLCAVTQRSDGHPDLHGAPGVLDYIVAAQPTAVLDLLDQLDAAESLCRKVGDMEQRLKDLEAKCHEAIKEAMQKLSQKLISEVTQ